MTQRTRTNRCGRKGPCLMCVGRGIPECRLRRPRVQGPVASCQHSHEGLAQPVSRTHLLAVQQHRQVIRHFAPVPNNPRKRVATSSPRTAEVCGAAIAASEHPALPPQLLQLSFIAQFLGRCAWCAWSAAPAARGGAARGDIEVWRWFERFESWRTHRLDGQQVRGGLAALGRRQGVFGCGEVCCRLYCRRRCS